MTLCNMVVEAEERIVPSLLMRQHLITFRIGHLTLLSLYVVIEMQDIFTCGHSKYGFLVSLYDTLVEQIPQHSGYPHSLDNLALAIQCKDVKIDRVYIGSCTGGKTEYFMAAAKLFHATGKQVKAPTFLVPDTQNVWMDVYALPPPEAGCDTPSSPSYSACFGGPADAYARMCLDNEQELPGSMEHKEGHIYLASPCTAAASALNGNVTDPREFLQ
ncbi:hypothetical protein Bca52824_007721 [Brassica carinata]|uniref:Aconitase/3-isopropylmalate dehydratase large subunit alpha/beta/alpha domain-containing protein n=1 Tax=Brassica carinata TaxID=52824 RepID=A0A8X7W6Q9_BRACI|nr:hypothetical protein Bca52824_007721 [Brassica carinata]